MKPKLVVCAGPPCSGKSTISAALADRFDCRWIQGDRVLSLLMPQSDRNENDRLVGYRAMLLTASEIIQCSRSVVLDATFTTPACRDLLRSCVREFRSETHVIQIRIAPDAAVHRFRMRTGHPAVDLTEARVRELAENYPYSSAGIVLDGETPVADLVQQAARFIGFYDEAESNGAA